MTAALAWLAAIIAILVLLAGAARLRDATPRPDEHEEGT
jgi:hypothetical protein